MTSKDLTNNFINIAIENGYATFKKKAAYKASEFTIFTVSLFKSKFGNFYLISIKVDIIGYNKFKDYELNNNYFSHDCGDLPIDPENVDFSFLDLDIDMRDDIRVVAIREYFENIINPLAKRLATLIDVKMFIYENKWELGCKHLLDYMDTIKK